MDGSVARPVCQRVDVPILAEMHSKERMYRRLCTPEELRGTKQDLKVVNLKLVSIPLRYDNVFPISASWVVVL